MGLMACKLEDRKPVLMRGFRFRCTENATFGTLDMCDEQDAFVRPVRTPVIPREAGHWHALARGWHTE